MKHVLYHWNRICAVHQVYGCSTNYLQFISSKCLVLDYLKSLLKMAEKRGPPIGAFQLNPLGIHMKVSAKGDGTPQSYGSENTSVEKLDRGTDDTEMKLVSHKVKQTTKTAKRVDSGVMMDLGVMMDSGVMMKMVVSGPPSQAKRQKVLPESLLQKVTDIVRQQTINSNASLLGEKENKSHDTNENTKDCMAEKDINDMKCNSLECVNTQPDTCTISAQNRNQYNVVSQPIAQSTDNSLCNSKGTNTVSIQLSEETQSLSITETLTSMDENDSLAHCLSCFSLDSTMETDESFINKTVDLNEGTEVTEKRENKVEAIEHVDEICGPPHSDKHDSDMAEINKEEMQMSVSETGMNLFENFFIDEVGEKNDKVEQIKETHTCTSDTETDPFSGLFLENENDIGNDKKTSKKDKRTDEIYNIAPLFTGELEKWRKRELKKEKKKAFKKKKDKSKNSVEKGSAETGDEKERKKEQKPVPNYFVAIQITNPKIHAGIRCVQEDVVSGNEKLKPALNKLATLHLTMFVVHLKTEDEMTRAKRAMDQCQKKLEPLYRNQLLSLDIGSLGNFRNSIVFAKVRSDEQVMKLREIADIVEDCFLDEEIVSTEKSGSFKPHITVMKLTRDKSFRKKGGIKKIDEVLYKEHIEAEFGQQYVNTLQLCAMLKKKAESGYYQVEHSVQFGPDISENITDTAETESTSIAKIDSEKLDTDTGVKDQGKEDIKMLLEELIRRVIDSDKIEIIDDDLNTKVLESDKTEEMEIMDSGEIIQNVNIDNTGSQGIHNETITNSFEVDSLKPEASITLIDNA